MGNRKAAEAEFSGWRVAGGGNRVTVFPVRVFAHKEVPGGFCPG